MFYTVGSPKHLSRTPSPSPTHARQPLARWARLFPEARSVVRSHPPAPESGHALRTQAQGWFGWPPPPRRLVSGPARFIAPVLPALLPARAPPPPEKKFPNSTPPGALSPRASGSVRSDRGMASRIRVRFVPCLFIRTRVLNFSFLPGKFGVVGWVILHKK